MESRKRTLPQAGILGRRVRARVEPEPHLDDFDDDASSGAPSEQEVDENESGSESASGDNSEEPDASDASSEDSDEEIISADASKVSFGALAKAQQAMLPAAGRRKKKGTRSESDDAEAEEASSKEPKAFPTKREKPPSRSSKHAPMETTSKRPVSRKREILAVRKMVARDPRFDPLITSRSSSSAAHRTGGGGSSQADEDRARRAYAFLDEYRDDEMRQLKVAVKKAKTPAEKEKLQRALMSMESRKKAQDKRAKERALIDEHRKREKELVKEGKKANPYYLKKSEQKKQLLVNQFAGLSEKQREHAIERRRKKVTSKEKKTLPMERRMRE
ncbi:unnamed protein product [Discula destructiva]